MEFSEKIFIDDIHKHHYIFRDEDGWGDLSSYDELENYMVEVLKTADENNFPKEVSFDMNLSYNSKKNGLSCASLVIDLCVRYGLKLPKCYVHSGNPFAYEKFVTVFEEQWKSVTGIEYELVRKKPF